MAVATVNGTAYPAKLDIGRESLTRDEYTQALTLVTERAGSAHSRRVWPVTFGFLTASELTTLRGLFKAPGSVTFGGDFVGSPSAACLATSIAWAWGDLADMATLTCTMVEVTPS